MGGVRHITRSLGEGWRGGREIRYKLQCRGYVSHQRPNLTRYLYTINKLAQRGWLLECSNLMKTALLPYETSLLIDQPIENFAIILTQS